MLWGLLCNFPLLYHLLPLFFTHNIKPFNSYIREREKKKNEVQSRKEGEDFYYETYEKYENRCMPTIRIV